MTLTDEVRENRRRVVSYLTGNPQGRIQILANLKDLGNGRCALGMACEALGIDVPGRDELDFSLSQEEAYEKCGGMLQFEVDVIWKMNDALGLSFREIAGKLEQEWNEEDK